MFSYEGIKTIDPTSSELFNLMALLNLVRAHPTVNRFNENELYQLDESTERAAVRLTHRIYRINDQNGDATLFILTKLAENLDIDYAIAGTLTVSQNKVGEFKKCDETIFFFDPDHLSENETPRLKAILDEHLKQAPTITKISSGSIACIKIPGPDDDKKLNVYFCLAHSMMYSEEAKGWVTEVRPTSPIQENTTIYRR